MEGGSLKRKERVCVCGGGAVGVGQAHVENLTLLVKIESFTLLINNIQKIHKE